LAHHLTIIKDSATSVTIATHDAKVSKAITGRSFLMDIEAANKMPSYTITSHLPYADNYYVTFENVADHFVQRAICKWFMTRSMQDFFVAYNPARSELFAGASFCVVFRSKEVPKIFKTATGDTLREITVMDAGDNPQVLVFHHKLQTLNSTTLPSIHARWDAKNQAKAEAAARQAARNATATPALPEADPRPAEILSDNMHDISPNSTDQEAPAAAAEPSSVTLLVSAEGQARAAPAYAVTETTNTDTTDAAAIESCMPPNEVAIETSLPPSDIIFTINEQPSLF